MTMIRKTTVEDIQDAIIIRTATINDLEEITELEAKCFPIEEAASHESFEWRLQTYPNHFWLLVKDGKIVSFINGPITKEADLTDEMYDSAAYHKEDGDWQMIFGVVTHPDYQHRGLASRLMERFIAHAKAEGRKGVVLTCKLEKIPFYERFGFKDEGLSASNHGGVPWNQMRLTF
jgi:ribosomal protein S18 acetylase RimI-like enzyme